MKSDPEISAKLIKTHSGTNRKTLGINNPLGEFDKLEYVHHDSFSQPDAEKEYWGARRRDVAVPCYNLLPEIPNELRDNNTSQTFLSPKDEVTLFLRYNFAKYRLKTILEKSGSGSKVPKVADKWHERAQEVRGQIVHANLPLVPAMAKRANVTCVEFGELISEGYMAVLRSVEKFDVSRGFKFSTYACWSILKCFYRLAAKTQRFRQHFPVEFNPEMERSDFVERRHQLQRSNAIETVREVLFQNQAALSEIERKIIFKRFPIMSEEKPKTLAEVGKVVGLTNERVRQIEKKTLSKIRSAFERDSAA